MKNHFFYIIFCFACFSIEACKTLHTAPTTDLENVAEIVKPVVEIPSHPLQSETDIDILMKEIGDVRVVVLGESTHGTHEFYQWREAITRRLISEKKFNLVTVEGDWSDASAINHFVNGNVSDSTALRSALNEFDRWPASLWQNRETAAWLQWLNNYNRQADGGGKVGFYGMDLYSFSEWTKDAPVVKDTALQAAIVAVRNGFAAYHHDAMEYHEAVRTQGADLSHLTERLWKLVSSHTNLEPQDAVAFNLRQQAKLTLDGEKYFRTMSRDRVGSWNLRDAFMAATVESLLHFKGKEAKMVIWTHNTHAGDTKYSTMSANGYASLANLLRNRLGRKNIFIMGFGMDHGTVLAANEWNSVEKNITVPAARPGSWEGLLHVSGHENKLVFSKEIEADPQLNRWLEFRSIGATYNGMDSYSQSIIPGRFDAFMFIDSTTPLRPLD